ncbi:MAG: VIT1/CCC1 transporter family protein [Candidatus Bathyarchaeota archaeon]|nr:MAG: VIT1/CCC1 transporter family protein [Candidatus Bathyarchaeota archaeon]
MSEEEIVDFAKKSLADEIHTSAIYQSLSKLYGEAPLSKELSGLSEMECEHSRFWMDFLEVRGVDASGYSVNRIKVYLLTVLYRLLGIGLTLKILEMGERRAIAQYSMMLRSSEISGEEKNSINQILLDELNHEEEFERYEARYKFFINRVATIFTQMSGGLVTVLSVSIGIAGVYDEPHIVAITGLIVGLTGALNTITGFYFFGRTQKKVKQGIMDRIRRASESVPQVYVRKVFDYMRKRDISEETARVIAEEARDKNMLTRIVAEEEYGIREGALGDPVESAVYAGFFKIIGTVLPLIPFFFGIPVGTSIPISIVITMLLLAVTGFLVAISAEIDVKDKILELTLSGVIMVVIVFLIGKSTSQLMKMFIE